MNSQTKFGTLDQIRDYLNTKPDVSVDSVRVTVLKEVPYFTLYTSKIKETKAEPKEKYNYEVRTFVRQPGIDVDPDVASPDKIYETTNIYPFTANGSIRFAALYRKVDTLSCEEVELDPKVEVAEEPVKEEKEETLEERLLKDIRPKDEVLDFNQKQGKKDQEVNVASVKEDSQKKDEEVKVTTVKEDKQSRVTTTTEAIGKDEVVENVIEKKSDSGSIFDRSEEDDEGKPKSVRSSRKKKSKK